MGNLALFSPCFAAKIVSTGEMGWPAAGGGTLRVGADDSRLLAGFKTITPSGVFFLCIYCRQMYMLLLCLTALVWVCFLFSSTAFGSRAACRTDMQGAVEVEGVLVFSSPSDGRTYFTIQNSGGGWVGGELERG